MKTAENLLQAAVSLCQLYEAKLPSSESGSDHYVVVILVPMDQPRIAKGKLASPKLVDQTLRTANRLLRLRDFTSSHQLKMADDTSEHDLLGGAIRIQVGDLQAVIAVAGFTEPQNEALALVAASWLDMIPSSNVLRVMHLSGNTEVESVFQLIEATKAA